MSLSETYIDADGERDTLPSSHPTLMKSGDVVGDYRIVDELGVGGMGVVYRAEQLSLNRQVALKLQNANSMNDPEALSRFLLEAKAGGRLQHPNIVTVHGAGEENGVYYIAQELVEGACSLRDVVADLQKTKSLGAEHYRELAKMMIKICKAMMHAHSSGVIHRDIKPGNILLDAQWEPRISDFGLAVLVDKKPVGRPGEISGSPYYMSPEQVIGRRTSIDHRTDQFSLGATLFELLTHTRAFAGDNINQIFDKILSQDPPDPRTLRGKVPEDLAAICLKMMEKRKRKRYANMGDVADDLGRFLDDEVIMAKAPGRITVASKWIRRHPVVAVSLLMGFGTFLLASLMLVNLEIQNAKLEQANEKVSREIRATKATVGVLVSMIQGMDPMMGDKQRRATRESLDKNLEKVRKDLREFPLASAEITTSLGRLYHHIGYYEEATEIQREVLTIFVGEYGEQHIKSTSALNELASGLKASGAYDEALPLMERYLELERELGGETSRLSMGAMHNLATLDHRAGRLRKAQALFEHCLSLRQEQLGETHKDTLDTMNNLGTVLKKVGDNERAEQLYRAVLAARRVEPGENHPSTAGSYTNLGLLLLSQNRLEEAHTMFSRSLNANSTVLGDSHPKTLGSLSNLAMVLRKQGRNDESYKLSRKAVTGAVQRLGSEHPTTISIKNTLAVTYAMDGDHERAEPLMTEVYASRKRVLGNGHPKTAMALLNLSELYEETGRRGQAIALLVGAVEELSKTQSPDFPLLMQTRHYLVELYLRKGDSALALPVAELLVQACSEEDCQQYQALLNRTQEAFGG